uniref:hypothetical protein n=1 Tax=Candidatus Electrothrix sp. TaxID=2170559 RepID=UPI004056E6B2
MKRDLFKVINGGRQKYFSIDGVRVEVTTRNNLPQSAEIMVFEEDTNMILTVDSKIHHQDEHPIRIMTDIYEHAKLKPGVLVTKGKSWYALVIDLDADCICQIPWIRTVYREIFKSIEQNRIKTAGIHLLGSTYGKIPRADALQLFIDGVKESSHPHLEKIVLAVDDSLVGIIKEHLTE